MPGRLERSLMAPTPEPTEMFGVAEGAPVPEPIPWLSVGTELPTASSRGILDGSARMGSGSSAPIDFMSTSAVLRLSTALRTSGVSVAKAIVVKTPRWTSSETPQAGASHRRLKTSRFGRGGLDGADPFSFAFSSGAAGPESVFSGDVRATGPLLAITGATAGTGVGGSSTSSYPSPDSGTFKSMKIDLKNLKGLTTWEAPLAWAADCSWASPSSGRHPVVWDAVVPSSQST